MSKISSTHVFGKDNEGTKVLCQLKQEAGILIETFNRSLISSVEEQGTTSLPISS